MAQNPIPSTLLVTKLKAGTGIALSPASGTGIVTVSVTEEPSTQVLVQKSNFLAALPADLISIVAAVTPSNVALTLVAQPPHSRKLQYRIVIGTTTTTRITAGTLTTIGFDQDGNALSEVVSLIANATKTIVSAHAWSSVTSTTVAAYAAAGSGTGNTIGIGLSNDFGVSTGLGTVTGLVCVKATKNTRTVVGSGTAVTTWTNAAADDVASTVTVDAVARTLAPTKAPDANGLVDYEFTYAYSLAA
jgi:hypothetical protein